MEDRKFSKERPCSKIEIWNAFYGTGSVKLADGSRSTDLSRARSIIGRHVPRVMCTEGRAEYATVDGEDHICLTMRGEVWLRVGLERYIENNPDRKHEVENPPFRTTRRKKVKTISRRSSNA